MLFVVNNKINKQNIVVLAYRAGPYFFENAARRATRRAFSLVPRHVFGTETVGFFDPRSFAIERMFSFKETNNHVMAEKVMAEKTEQGKILQKKETKGQKNPQSLSTFLKLVFVYIFEILPNPFLPKPGYRYVKIGSTARLWNRWCQLRTSQEMKLVAISKLPEGKTLETQFHIQYSEFRQPFGLQPFLREVYFLPEAVYQTLLSSPSLSRDPQHCQTFFKNSRLHCRNPKQSGSKKKPFPKKEQLRVRQQTIAAAKRKLCTDFLPAFAAACSKTSFMADELYQNFLGWLASEKHIQKTDFPSQTLFGQALMDFHATKMRTSRGYCYTLPEDTETTDKRRNAKARLLDEEYFTEKAYIEAQDEHPLLLNEDYFIDLQARADDAVRLLNEDYFMDDEQSPTQTRQE